MSDSSSSGVNDSQFTSENPERPVSDKSGTEKAYDWLKSELAAGRDYVNKELPTKVAKDVGKMFGCKHGIVYSAREKIQNEIQKQLIDSAGKSIDADIDVDDLIKGAKEVGGGAPIGGGSSGPTGSQQELMSEPPKEKKPPVPIDPKMLQTISDAFLGAIFDQYQEHGKEIPAEQQKTLKTTYNTTYEAYGVSIPKWALIPLCVAATIVILGLPMRREIQEGIISIRDMIAGQDSKEDLK